MPYRKKKLLGSIQLTEVLNKIMENALMRKMCAGYFQKASIMTVNHCQEVIMKTIPR